MFKLQPNPTFKAKVPISIAGESKTASITVEFKHMGRTAALQFFTDNKESADLPVLMQMIVGWEGVDAPFSEETLGLLLDRYPSSASSMMETFRRELFEAKTKN